MSKSWIVVSNSTNAKIYAAPRAKLLNGHGAESMVLIKELEHPQSRLKKQDLVTDQPGRWGHSQYAMTSDPVDLELEHFAHEIAQLLEKSRLENEFDDLILVSPAHFLGKMNHFIKDHHSLSNLVSISINKDYVNEKPEILWTHIKDKL